MARTGYQPVLRFILRLALDAELLFFLFLDDDSRRDHHHQALGFAADADVLEQAVDVGNLVEQRHAELVAAFAEAA